MDLYHYEVTEKGEGRILFKVTYNEDHELFKGHFPSKPVVPGVMLMQTVKELFEYFADISSAIESADLKFMNPVIPGSVNAINIEMNYSANDGGIFKIKSSGFSGETKFFKISVSLQCK